MMAREVFLMRLPFCLLLLIPLAAGAQTPASILEKSDRSRGGASSGISWKISLKAGESQASEYDVKVKGVNVLAKCTAPARQKGETFLFNDRNLWIHKPGLKKPVSLSPRQRLSGQAANGDIATTNYARDYEAKVEDEETVGGKPAWKLFLQAKEKNVTYDKIRYWVTKKDFLGVKAEFLTLEGKPFKLANFTYGHTLPGSKVPFVSQMEIRDVSSGETTTITYGAPRAEEIGDSLFNVNNLQR
jgi:outer membrane lipoprotein-sorting protein